MWKKKKGENVTSRVGKKKKKRKEWHDVGK